MVKLRRDKDYELLYDMDRKLDSLVSTMAVTCDQVTNLKKTVNGNGQPGHEQRIKSLEFKWVYITGGAGVLLALIEVLPRFMK